jgi:Ca2+-binding EF-hand superfamily protein
MDRRGPHFYIFLLQVNLIFLGIYAGLLLMTFLPFMYEEYSPSFFFIYLTLAALPVVGVTYNKKQLVAALAQVCSVGSYRKPQIVSDVLREEKTYRVVRTFIILHKMRHAARMVHGLAPRQPPRNGRDGSFSRLELYEVGKSFDALDTDKSGRITGAEFQALLARLGNDMTDEGFYRMMAILDTDRDGYVTRDEFLSWYASQAESDSLSLKERAKDLFGLFDQNKSGEITIGELKSKLDALQMGFSVDEVGAIVNELDHDRNGAVGEEEFEKMLKKYYPKELLRTE